MRTKNDDLRGPIWLATDDSQHPTAVARDRHEKGLDLARVLTGLIQVHACLPMQESANAAAAMAPAILASAEFKAAYRALVPLIERKPKVKAPAIAPAEGAPAAPKRKRGRPAA